jgi:hypothetical protein
MYILRTVVYTLLPCASKSIGKTSEKLLLNETTLNGCTVFTGRTYQQVMPLTISAAEWNVVPAGFLTTHV